MAHSLQWLRKILAISKLSDKTRSFLSVLLKEIYEDWNKTNREETRKLEDLLTTFLNLDSLDLQRALGKASGTLSQTFVLYLDGEVKHQCLPSGGIGNASWRITVPGSPRQTLHMEQLDIAPDTPRSRSILKLLHGSRQALSSRDLPDGLGLWINQDLHEPKARSLIVDITPQLEKHNRLEVRVGATGATWDINSHFAVTIERWIVWSRLEIVGGCKTISSEKVLDSIISRMASSCEAAIDVIDTSLVIRIDLFEPFSKSRIFDIPVRGEDCSHYDAFDLEVFLETRSETCLTGRLTRNDWRCPICFSDCTPGKLVKDEFLVKVREHLEATGQLNTRSIIVDHAGNWQRVVDNAVDAIDLDVET